jgi:hypothetical protein
MESKAYKLNNYLRNTYLLCENNYVCDVCVNVGFLQKKNLKWTEVIGINSNVKEYNKPVSNIIYHDCKNKLVNKH